MANKPKLSIVWLMQASRYFFKNQFKQNIVFIGLFFIVPQSLLWVYESVKAENLSANMQSQFFEPNFFSIWLHSAETFVGGSLLVNIIAFFWLLIGLMTYIGVQTKKEGSKKPEMPDIKAALRFVFFMILVLIILSVLFSVFQNLGPIAVLSPILLFSLVGLFSMGLVLIRLEDSSVIKVLKDCLWINYCSEKSLKMSIFFNLFNIFVFSYLILSSLLMLSRKVIDFLFRGYESSLQINSNINLVSFSNFFLGSLVYGLVIFLGIYLIVQVYLYARSTILTRA